MENRGLLRLRRGCIVAAVLFVLFVVWAILWPPFYYQDPIEARVIDAETHAPIAGAGIAAEWEMSVVPFGNSKFLRIDDAITNGDGRFRLSAWRARRPLFAYFTRQDPTMYIYHPGYQLRIVDNNAAYVKVVGLPDKDGHNTWYPTTPPGDRQIVERHPGWSWGGSKRFCYWNGQEISLAKSGSLQDDFQSLAICTVRTIHDRRLTRFWTVWQSGFNRIRVQYEQLPPEKRSVLALSPPSGIKKGVER